MFAALWLAGAWEWAGLARLGSAGRAVFTLLLAVAIGAAFWLTDESVTRVLLTTTLLFWLMAIGAVLTFPRTFGFAVTLVSGFLVLLPSWLLLVRLHASAPHGTGLCMTLLAVVWASDVGAYAFGRWLGRTKLAPAVSPGKTWEGAIGGLILAGLAAGEIGRAHV